MSDISEGKEFRNSLNLRRILNIMGFGAVDFLAFYIMRYKKTKKLLKMYQTMGCPLALNLKGRKSKAQQRMT